jgi:hypothetical protein
MTFTKPEQTKHRKAFIDECRQRAWGAACHADWISKGLAGITAHYEKLQAEDRALEEAIKAAELAVDYHTVENRNKRKAMQERRDTLAQEMKDAHQRERPIGPTIASAALRERGEQPRTGVARGRSGNGRRLRPAPRNHPRPSDFNPLFGAMFPKMPPNTSPSPLLATGAVGERGPHSSRLAVFAVPRAPLSACPVIDYPTDARHR